MGAEFAELPPPQPWRKEAQLARDPFREVPLRYLGMLAAPLHSSTALATPASVHDLTLNIIFMINFHLIITEISCHLYHRYYLCLHIPGYANEVGEAFRHMVGVRWVYLTYLVSSSYVAAHALQQGVRASRPTSPHVYTSFLRNKKISNECFVQGGIIKTSHESHVTKMSPSGAVVDTLVWQGLASVGVPGFTINRVCALSRLLLRQRVFQRQMAMSPALQKWTVTAVGLGCIPFIIQPIDR